LLPVAVAQRLAHLQFAGSIVVVPAVVHEIDAAIDGGADDADTLFIRWASDVISAQSNRGNLFAGAAKCLVWNSAALFRCPQICPRRAHRGHACRNFQKSPPRNSTILFNVLWGHMPLLSLALGARRILFFKLLPSSTCVSAPPWRVFFSIFNAATS